MISTFNPAARASPVVISIITRAFLSLMGGTSSQPASYGQNPNFMPQHHQSPPASYNSEAHSQYHRQVKLDKKYSRISDNYSTLEQVIAALAESGLESSNLIIGIDFTKSNEWTGSRSFKRRCLHHIGHDLNPYEEAISIVGKTLSTFDEDNLIPCFGFGDASTHDQDVFSFYRDGIPCNGFEGVLSRYREIVPHLRLSGPTSFAPLIETAMKIVDESYGQYHVLLIIADGQVTRSADTSNGLSRQETQTIDAIVRASEYPLSIVLVGVGDGPWDIMNEFDDNIPARAFDNFQFVNFTEIMSRNINPLKKEAEFALAALMEIPSQYKATLQLNLLGRQTGRAPDKVSLPPPISSTPVSFGSNSIQHHFYLPSTDIAPSSFSADDNRVCPICLVDLKDMAFGCGHQTCCDCGETLDTCPICRRAIYTKIKLYG